MCFFHRLDPFFSPPSSPHHQVLIQVTQTTSKYFLNYPLTKLYFLNLTAYASSQYWATSKQHWRWWRCYWRGSRWRTSQRRGQCQRRARSWRRLHHLSRGRDRGRGAHESGPCAITWGSCKLSQSIEEGEKLTMTIKMSMMQITNTLNSGCEIRG